METFSRQVRFLLAIFVMCQGGLAGANEFSPYLESRETQAADDPKTATSSPVLVKDSGHAEACSLDTVCDNDICTPTQPRCQTWTIDYRVRTMFDSHTTYEFGADTYAPLSRLAWSLNSTWHGLQIGLEKPNWQIHFEWLAPMLQGTYGNMDDYDWSGPDRAPASLSTSPERWNDGQMLDLEASFKLTDRFFTLPIEVWPVAGFRFQRFDIMAYDGVQLINDGTMGPDIPPVGYRWNEDTVSFNQQYYMGYVGGQLCTTLKISGVNPLKLTFEGDWAGTAGYNVDHHISGYEAQGKHRYTMEDTRGGALHLAITAESLIGKHLSVGIRADHTEIRTTGTHRLFMYGAESIDVTIDNGVAAKSDQNSLTAFFRARF